MEEEELKREAADKNEKKLEGDEVQKKEKE